MIAELEILFPVIIIPSRDRVTAGNSAIIPQGYAVICGETCKIHASIQIIILAHTILEFKAQRSVSSMPILSGQTQTAAVLVPNQSCALLNLLLSQPIFGTEFQGAIRLNPTRNGIGIGAHLILEIIIDIMLISNHKPRQTRPEMTQIYRVSDIIRRHKITVGTGAVEYEMITQLETTGQVGQKTAPDPV